MPVRSEHDAAICYHLVQRQKIETVAFLMGLTVAEVEALIAEETKRRQEGHPAKTAKKKKKQP